MTSPVPPSGPVATLPAPRRSPVGWIVLVVLGCLLLLPAAGALLGGGALLWANETQRDDAGFFTSGTERFETLTHAITSEAVDLRLDDGRPARNLGDLATVRLRVEGRSENPVFVGIGRREDVEAYLGGVARAEVADVSFDPFRVSYRFVDGDRSPGPPGDEDFWVAQAEGVGPQSVEWEVRSGEYVVVVMNDDGSPGVGVDASVGVKLEWLGALAVVLLVGGGVALVIALAMLVAGIAGLVHSGARMAPAIGPPPGPSPAHLTGRLDGPGRWLWLVKWLLLIPHFVVLAFLWLAFALLTVVAWFAIVFTARYPRGIFDFNVGVLRWTWRVSFYAFGVNGTDRYPPFSLGGADDYPATFDVAYPERLSRGLVLVKSWLLAIPHYVVVGILVGGTRTAWTEGGQRVEVPVMGLNSWLVLVAVIALLFVGRYPQGLFDLLVGLNRWIFRVVAYAALMTDAYPPFRLDQGGDEPALAGPDPGTVPPTSPPP